LGSYNPLAALKASKYLSSFQLEKYTYMFNNLFDLEKVTLWNKWPRILL
jgi:hypothetical protein